MDKERCYLGGGESGDAAAYAGDVECQFGVSAGKFNEGIDIGADCIDAALHGGDGIGVALQSFALAPDGSEAFMGDVRGSAGMCSCEIAAEHEDVVGTQGRDVIGRKFGVQRGVGYSGRARWSRGAGCGIQTVGFRFSGFEEIKNSQGLIDVLL